jgi:hypothetical protein
MKKVFLLVLVALVPVSAIFCVDWTHGPETVQPGSILINGALAVGNVSATGISEILFGFNVAVDYALNVYGLSVGGETGYIGGSDSFGSYGIVPIAFRFGYHPDFEVEKLDLYGLVKLGMGNGNAYGGSSMGFGIGIGLGVRYLATDNIAVLTELGIDRYSFTVLGTSIAASKILTLGITYNW